MLGILCFGDSITFGRGEVPARGWAGRLKDFFEAQNEYNAVYNLGVPGHTSADLLRRIETEAFARVSGAHEGSKFLIIIAIGTNDAKWDGMPSDKNPRTEPEKFEANLKFVLKKAESLGFPVVTVGLPPVDEKRTLPFEDTSFKNERVELFNETIRKVSLEFGVPFIDVYKEMLKKNYSELLADGLHPNTEGYDFMFEKIKDFLISNKLISLDGQ